MYHGGLQGDSMNTIDAINFLRQNFEDQERRISEMEKRNSALTKVVANVRSNLERSLKNPSLLNQSVYDSIDLCRGNFKYMDYSSGQIKQDPPLSSEEKILP